MLAWALAVVLYAIMAAYLVAPAYMDSQQRIIGGGELGGWLWRYWWMKLEIVALTHEFPHDLLQRFFYMISLGRFPETGNITDLYAVSVPLDLLFGHPGHYNAKVFLIFLTNALSAYAYVHYLTSRRGVALIAGVTYACNAFVFYEVQRSGLRQAILCFIPLYALFLDRLLEERKPWLGAAAAAAFAATAVFYWFYGMFMAAYSVFRLGWYAYRHRGRLNATLLKPLAVLTVVAPLLIVPFMMPYLSKTYQDANAVQLPEMTFFKSFPTVEQLQNVPLRPNTREENLLASLARVLSSSWHYDWVYNPLQSWVVPAVMLLLSVLMGLMRWRKTAFWLVLFAMFYSLTWGPYLQNDGKVIALAGGYNLRLPYWYVFKFVPPMSRLFAPYRMGSIVVFSMTVLLGLNLTAIAHRLEGRPRIRIALGVLFLVAYLGQFKFDAMRYYGIGSNKMLPLEASEVTVPAWYYQLAKEPGRIGIVELPLDRQQDLLNYYQVVHAKKVMGGWATPGALPPKLRFGKPSNKVTAYLQWLSRPDGLGSNKFARAIRSLGQMPYSLSDFEEPDLVKVHNKGYRYVVLHELGCYLLEPRWGKELYQRMKNQLESRLGEPVHEFVELEPTGNSEEMIPFLNGMPWVPSIYSPLLIPEPRPYPMHMIVFAIKPAAEKEAGGTEAGATGGTAAEKEGVPVPAGQL